jgi:hypothetical protein
LNFEGQEQARLHLKSKPPWSYEWGPVQLEKKYPAKFLELDKAISKFALRTNTTYKKDTPIVEYVRHIRNAVSHAKVAITPNDSVEFEDENAKTNEKFSTIILLKDVGQLLNELQKVHQTYLKDRQSGSTP